MALSKKDAHDRVAQLADDLRALQARDPEQEVQGLALPVLDAAFEAARLHLDDDDPLRQVAVNVLSPEMVAAGEPLRAADALVVAGQLKQALYEFQIGIA